MTPVLGKDVHLYVNRSSAWKFTACATDLAVEYSQEMISTTTAEGTSSNTYTIGYDDMTITLDGVVTLDETTGWQFKEWISGIATEQSLLLTFDNSWGDRTSWTMSAIVESVNVEGSGTDFSTYTIVLRRCGAHTETIVYDCLLDSNGDPILDIDGYLIR